MLTAVLPPVFQFKIALFNEKFKAVADRKFEEFSKDMIEAAATITAGGANVLFSANSATHSSNDAINRELIANTVANAVAAAFQSAEATRNNGRSRGRSGTPGQSTPNQSPRNRNRAQLNSSTSTMHYCWSHGPNPTHDSMTCLYKHAHHDNTATFANKKGGKTTLWERGQPLGP
jgi:hypothetical protein